MPAYAEISQGMEEFSNTTYLTSELHKDSTKARISIDNCDMKALAEFLEAMNPFDGDQSLHCISSGVVADETFNVDTAKDIGESHLKSMENKCVEDFTFKKKSQAFRTGINQDIIQKSNNPIDDIHQYSLAQVSQVVNCRVSNLMFGVLQVLFPGRAHSFTRCQLY